MKIKITKIGLTPQQLEKDIEFKFKAVKKGLALLGIQTKEHMQNTIETNRKRPGGSHRLQNAIKVYLQEEPKRTMVGVGDITELNTYAPYWHLLNYGGFSGVAKRGMLVPGYFGNYNPPSSMYKGTGKGTEEFHYTPLEASADRENTFFMKPESPIEAVNYIEKAANWAIPVWKTRFHRWIKKTKLHTR